MDHDRIAAEQYTSCCHCAKCHYYKHRQQIYIAGLCEETVRRAPQKVQGMFFVQS